MHREFKYFSIKADWVRQWQVLEAVSAHWLTCSRLASVSWYLPAAAAGTPGTLLGLAVTSFGLHWLANPPLVTCLLLGATAHEPQLLHALQKGKLQRIFASKAVPTLQLQPGRSTAVQRLQRPPCPRLNNPFGQVVPEVARVQQHALALCCHHCGLAGLLLSLARLLCRLLFLQPASVVASAEVPGPQHFTK